MSIYDIKKEGFISSDTLATWAFEFDKKEMTTVEQAGKVDNVLRKKLKFCYPYRIEVDNIKPLIQMAPSDPSLKEVLEKNNEVMKVTKELTDKYSGHTKLIKKYPESSGPIIIIDWSVNLYLKLNSTYKKVLVKPKDKDFQLDKRCEYPVISTMIDGEMISFSTNAHIWFPESIGKETAKKNIPYLNKALEMLDKELKPKKIGFEDSGGGDRFQGAKLFEHGLRIRERSG